MNRRIFALRPVMTLIMALILTALSISAYTRNSVWQDDMRLWEDAALKSFGKARPHNNLGVAFRQRGYKAKAYAEYMIALKFNPQYADAYNNLAVLHALDGRFEEALESARSALSIEPGSEKAHNNLGNIYQEMGRPEEALKEYRTALRINPQYEKAQKNLSLLLKNRGGSRGGIKGGE